MAIAVGKDPKPAYDANECACGSPSVQPPISRSHRFPKRRHKRIVAVFDHVIDFCYSKAAANPRRC